MSVVGRIPVVNGSLGSMEKHNLEIIVEKDPEMRRPYIVMDRLARRLVPLLPWKGMSRGVSLKTRHPFPPEMVR